MDKQQAINNINSDRLNAFVNFDEAYVAAQSGSGPVIAADDSLVIAGQLSSAGSRMLANFRPPYQCEALQRLMEAGYVLAGHTNIDEFNMTSGGETGWFGPVRHPHDASRLSSGAAAAVAGGCVDGALIVDVGGANARQAALAGCAALRPTYGAVSRFGIIACVSSSEQIAAVAPGVAQAAALLQKVAGYDEKDATSLPSQSYDYQVGSVAGKKLALLLPESCSAELQAAMQAAVAALTAAGATVEPVQLQYAAYAAPAFAMMLAAEGCNNISRFDGVKYGYRAAGYRDIEELYIKSRSEAMGANAKLQAMLGTYVLSKGNYERYYLRALQTRRLIRDEYTQLFQTYDAALSPAGFGSAYAPGERRAYTDSALTAGAAMSGLPALFLPLSCGPLPPALQICAESGQENHILAVGAAVEGGLL